MSKQPGGAMELVSVPCPRPRRGAAFWGGGLALIAGMAVAGCDNTDATSAAIDRARVALDGISLPLSPVGAEGDDVEADLSRIVTELRTASASASAGQKQAASLLMAQAQLGVADRRAAVSSQEESRASTSLTPIRRAIDQLLSSASASVAALAYDAGPEIERLQAAIQSKDAEIAQRQRDRAQIEGDILLLEQGAKERLDMAAARRDEAARMAVEAMALSTQESASRMEEVHRLRREAAAVEVDGATLQARADLRRPDLVERGMLVDQVLAQRAALEAALKSAREGATEARANAVERATEAAQGLEEVQALIGAALSHRSAADGVATSASDAYAAALASARAAGYDGVALVGAAAQGQGDVHWARGQNLGQLAALLEQLAGAPVPPALPTGEQQRLRGILVGLGEQAQALRQQQREALSAAADAYAEARDAFQRVRGTDDASRARVNRLAQLMHQCRRGANGQAIDLTTITDEQGDFTEESEQPIPVEPDGGIGDTPGQGEGGGDATGG